MVTVFKYQDEIVVRCSQRELINVKKIKDIAKTIKKIHKDNTEQCKIVVESIDNLNFTLLGLMFYRKITSIRKTKKMKFSIQEELFVD